jgi:uncharacterized protein YjbJ (UPF0337 family)
MHRYDRPDDSEQNRHAPGSVSEEVSGAGQRFKGAMKEAVGDAIDDEDMEEKGERENEAGKKRQRRNAAV